MNFNKNNDDIIDAEFVVEANQGTSAKQSEPLNSAENQYIHQYQFHSNQNKKNFSAHSFSWNINNRKGKLLTWPNFIILLLLSPIIIIILTLLALIFLFVFILFMPKIISIMKNKGQIFRNQNDVFKNIFNRKI